MSIKVPQITIHLANLKPFSKVNRVTAAHSWQTLTDTCTILMPKNIRVKQGDRVLNGLNDTVKRGDPVKVMSGYKPNQKVEFQGFVRQVKKNIPLEIVCEDFAYLLKLDTYSISWKSVNLKTIVSHLLTGPNIKAKIAEGFSFKVDVLDADPFPFAIPKENGAQALLQLFQTFGIVSYFRYDPDGLEVPTLVVGFKYPGKRDRINARKPILRTGLNVIDWNLEYLNKDDVQVRIQAIINRKNGIKQIIEVGNPEGTLRTLNYPDMPEDLVRRSAEEKLSEFQKDGFDGTVKIPGIFFIQHGDVVVLDDPIYTNEKGYYFVDGTVWTFTEEPRVTRELTIGEAAR
jgi:hypothetical protein